MCGCVVGKFTTGKQHKLHSKQEVTHCKLTEKHDITPDESVIMMDS